MRTIYPLKSTYPLILLGILVGLFLLARAASCSVTSENKNSISSAALSTAIAPEILKFWAIAMCDTAGFVGLRLIMRYITRHYCNDANFLNGRSHDG